MLLAFAIALRRLVFLKERQQNTFSGLFPRAIAPLITKALITLNFQIFCR